MKIRLACSLVISCLQTGGRTERTRASQDCERASETDHVKEVSPMPVMSTERCAHMVWATSLRLALPLRTAKHIDLSIHR
jgi:hypothetical protein